jgi:hypothetical protein
MLPAFQHFAYSAWINTVARRDMVLEFTRPVAQPDIYSIIKGQPAWLWIFRLHDGSFRERAGYGLTASTY